MSYRILVALILFTLSLSAEEKLYWPDKHGPTLNGLVPQDDLKKIPLHWGDKGKNIAWKTSLEGFGHSSPIIAGDKVWFTAANATGTKQFIYCLNRIKGKVIHHKLLFENSNPELLGNRTNTYATPSCVLEKGFVYVHFGTYGTACLNSKTAEVIWQRRDIKARHFRGPASSPLLYKHLLILSFDAVDRQFTVALNKSTGEQVWLTKRSVDYKDLVDGKPKREGDYRKAFNTPSLAEIGDNVQLLSIGARAAYGYDVLTGKEIWTVRHKNMNAAVRPLWVSEHQMVVINTGSGRATLLGLKLDKSKKGDLTDDVSWAQKRGSRYCLPLYFEGNLYQVTHDGTISCSDLKTGEKHWSKSLPNKFMASPLLIGSRIYMFDEFGKTIIIEASAKNFKVIAENEIDADVSASPAAADGALFIRTKKALYKISHK